MLPGYDGRAASHNTCQEVGAAMKVTWDKIRKSLGGPADDADVKVGDWFEASLAAPDGGRLECCFRDSAENRDNNKNNKNNNRNNNKVHHNNGRNGSYIIHDGSKTP